MIVDDSLVVRQQVFWALAQAGYEVIEATNGAERLQAVQTNDSIAMIICDVNMPVMNGLELLAGLSALAFTRPVVMLTSEGQPELIAKAKASGAKGWMVKPIAPDLLVATARKLAGEALKHWRFLLAPGRPLWS